MTRRIGHSRPTSSLGRGRWPALLAGFALVALAVVTVSPGLAAAQPLAPGTLDPAFGPTSTPPGTVSSTAGDGATGVAYMSTAASSNPTEVGDLAVSGGSTAFPSQFQVSLFTSSGAADTQFAPLSVNPGTANPFAGEALAVTTVPTGPATGDVVAAGYIKPSSPVCGGTGPDPVIAGFTPTGTLAFATDLLTASNCQLGTGWFNAVTVDAKGNIVAAGQTTTPSLATAGLVVRLTPTGVLDTTFATTGYLMTFAVAGGQSAAFTSVAVVPAVPTGYTAPTGIAAATDAGDVVVGGYSTTALTPAGDLTVAAYSGTTGLPDTNFGTGGTAQVAAATMANGLAVISATWLSTPEAPLGDIVAVGPSSTNPNAAVMVQLQANGQADAAFGTGGQVAFQSATSSYQLNAVAYQPSEGFLTVSGALTTPNTQPPPPGQPPQIQSALVGQYNVITGAANTPFGTKGTVVEGNPNNEPESAAAVAVQPLDGKTVIAGETPTVNGVENTGLMRFIGPTVSVSNAPTVSVPPTGAPSFQQGSLTFGVSLTEPLPLTSCPVLSVAGPGTVVKSPLGCPTSTLAGIGSNKTSASVQVTVNMAAVLPGSALGEQSTVATGNGLLAGGTTTASGTIQRVFNPITGLAYQIAIGANGSTWVLGTNNVPGGHGVFHWTGTGWTEIPGGAVQIAVDSSGNPWVINSFHNIFHWNGTGWVGYSGLATAISVGANGALWVIGVNSVPGGGGVFHYTGGWSEVPGGAVAIAVDPTGNPWVVNSFHNIFHWNGTGWVGYSGAATAISVGANGALWVIAANSVPGGGGIYHYAGGWAPVPGGAVAIAVDPTGEPWLVNSVHTIFES